MSDIEMRALDRELKRGSAELLILSLPWSKGTCVEKPDERRRRFHRLRPEGKRVLAQQRTAFVEAVRHVTGTEHA